MKLDSVIKKVVSSKEELVAREFYGKMGLTLNYLVNIMLEIKIMNISRGNLTVILVILFLFSGFARNSSG